MALAVKNALIWEETPHNLAEMLLACRDIPVDAILHIIQALNTSCVR
jgi:hypothetical protein